MKNKIVLQIYLFLGTLFLYSSMTCFHYSNLILRNSISQMASVVNKKEDSSIVVSAIDSVVDVEPKQSIEPAKVVDNINIDTANKVSPSALNTKPTEIPVTSSPVISSDKLLEDVPNVPVPSYVRGIYISNHLGNSKSHILNFITKAKQYQLNTFVIDIQPRMISKEIVNILKKEGIYTVARTVCFQDGLKTEHPPEDFVLKIIASIHDSAAQGFQEIQLDYIRYADNYLTHLPVTRKYEILSNFLARIKKVTDAKKILVGADIFGRITLNQHDIIGQRLEVYATSMYSLYPMVYPSHYNHDPYRTNHPYFTIREGVEKSKNRIPSTKVIPYIQGFKMKIDGTALTFKDYIKKQIIATADAGGDGWIIWNARNDYSVSYTAIAETINYKPKTSLDHQEYIKKQQQELELKQKQQLIADTLAKQKAQLASKKISIVLNQKNSKNNSVSVVSKKN